MLEGDSPGARTRPPVSRPTALDRAYQSVFRLGYRLVRRWWRLTRPRSRGAFVAVWAQGRILTLQNSYVSFRSFPGGGIRRHEAPSAAAARECREEVGLAVSPASLQLEFVTEQDWEGKKDVVWMYRIELEEAPPLRVDHREVVEARFMVPSEALAGPLFWPARKHLEEQDK